MTDYGDLLDVICRVGGGAFGPAEPDDLRKLEELGLPPAIVSFFAKYEPIDCIDSQARLWPISDIMVANHDMYPGFVISPHGYIVFATTYCGDAYCFDLNRIGNNGEPLIVLVSHEVDFREKDATQRQHFAKPIASTLLEFLQTLERIELDEKCIYS